MDTRGFKICAAAVGILPVTAGCTDQAPPKHPNILFILSDDHTSQSWGIYGGILAPYAANDNIARLAAEGCVLDNAFCTNSISVPSRAAILTGQYSHLNGVYTLDDALRPEQDNIAKRLQQAGYRTALIGKWHLKKEPAGFDYYSVFHDQGTYRDPVFKTAENWMDDDKGVGGAVEKGFSTDLVTDKAIRWIKERDRTKPFSVFCHFKATHEPCDFPERFAHLYDGVKFPEPENLLEFGPAKSGRTFAGQPLETMAWRWNKAYTDPENWWTYYPELPFCGVEGDSVANRRAIYQKLVRDYLRCAAAIDDNIGRLLRTLDEEGLAENTVVIYVSDQGYFLGEHGFFDKRIMYEEPLRMPFVIRYPKEIPAGTRNGDIAAAGSGAQFPEQPRGRHSAGMAPQHVLPLLDPARDTPGAHGHPQRPLQADLLLRRPARHDRLGRLRLDALVGILRPADRSARKPEPIRQPGLCGGDRSDETRDARTAPTIQGHRRRVGAHAGDHGDPLRPQKRKTLTVRIKKQNRT